LELSNLTGWSACLFVIVYYLAFLLMFTVAREIHPELLTNATAFTALAHIWLFGLAVWLLRFRSIVLILMVFSFAFIPTMAPLVFLEAPLPFTQWQPFIALYGGLLAGIGLLLTWRAYRRWLVADFD